MDDDPGKERPKPVEDGEVVKLQQSDRDTHGEQRIEHNPADTLEFGGTKRARRPEICDCKRDLKEHGKRAAPTPDRIRRRVHREQQDPKQGIREREYGIAQQQAEPELVHSRPLMCGLWAKNHDHTGKTGQSHRDLGGDAESFTGLHTL